MSDYAPAESGAVSNGWGAPTGSSSGLPAGVPGLPTGSTGQAPAPDPFGPRADSAPPPPAAPGGTQAPIPGATPWYQGIVDFFSGNTQVGDYKGGGAPALSTDDSRDLGQTAGQQQQSADKAAAAAPTPNSPYSGIQRHVPPPHLPPSHGQAPGVGSAQKVRSRLPS